MYILTALVRPTARVRAARHHTERRASHLFMTLNMKTTWTLVRGTGSELRLCEKVLKEFHIHMSEIYHSDSDRTAGHVVHMVLPAAHEWGDLVDTAR